MLTFKSVQNSAVASVISLLSLLNAIALKRRLSTVILKMGLRGTPL